MIFAVLLISCRVLRHIGANSISPLKGKVISVRLYRRRGGIEVQSHLFITSAPDKCEWPTLHPDRLIPGKASRCPLYRRLDKPYIRSRRLQRTEILFPLWGLEIQTIQLIEKQINLFCSLTADPQPLSKSVFQHVPSRPLSFTLQNIQRCFKAIQQLLMSSSSSSISFSFSFNNVIQKEISTQVGTNSDSLHLFY